MEYMEIKNNPNLTMEEIAFILLTRSCESARHRCNLGKGKYKHVKCELTPNVLRGLLKQRVSFWNEWVKLTEEWVIQGFCEKNRPTLDRIDKDGHYDIDNIQALPHKANSSKANVKQFAVLVFNDNYQIVKGYVIWGIERAKKMLGIPTSKAQKYKEDKSIFNYVIFINQSQAKEVEQKLSLSLADEKH